RRRHTRCYRDWSSDVCSSDLGRDPGLDRPPDRRALLDVLRTGAVLFHIAPCPWLLPLRTGGPSETGFWAYGYPFAWVSRRSKGVGGMGRISAFAGWRKSGLLVFALAT